MPQQKPWIHVYPFEERETILTNHKLRPILNDKLHSYSVELWQPRAEKGWTSSWIPFAKSLTFGDNDVIVNAGTMSFWEVDGMNQSIEQGKPFAPKDGYTPCLSVGFPTATRDGKVIFQRRAPDVHCPNMLIHEPCGYMSSMSFVPRAESADSQYKNDPRLFDLTTQLEARKREIAETFGLDPGQITYNPQQDFLAAGWKTTEMYFSCTGKIDANESDLKLPEGEFFFLPLEDIKPLIYNQGKLAGIDASNYRPDNPADIPLIDESLTGLIWGYESLTGEKINIPDTVDRLREDGLGIIIKDTSSRTTYSLPTSF